MFIIYMCVMSVLLLQFLVKIHRARDVALLVLQSGLLPVLDLSDLHTAPQALLLHVPQLLFQGRFIVQVIVPTSAAQADVSTFRGKEDECKIPL